jgi:hypothetical protein
MKRKTSGGRERERGRELTSGIQTGGGIAVQTLAA